MPTPRPYNTQWRVRRGARRSAAAPYTPASSAFARPAPPPSRPVIDTIRTTGTARMPRRHAAAVAPASGEAVGGAEQISASRTTAR